MEEQGGPDKKDFWNRLSEILLAPRVDDDTLKEVMADASTRQPPPVLWLLGKTQSGKSSIIRALTGSSAAEIGNGFRPCTRTAQFFDFPMNAPLVRFLDTRGLGEVSYDPGEDIRYCEAQSHLLVVVLKAMDLSQDSVLDVVRAVRKRHPDWPLLVVQTGLHDGYDPDHEHILPYPWLDKEWQNRVPGSLARALQAQRQWFADMPGDAPVRFVPVDFTREDDGFDPVNYGLDALWDAIEEVSTFGLRARLQGDASLQDAYADAAHPHIVGYSLVAGGVGALPVIDIAMVPAVQMKMLHTLASIYRLPWNNRTISEFFGMLGAGFAAGYALKLAGRSLIKLIPAWGQTAGAVWTASTSAAVTFALGKAAVYYLSRVGNGIPVDVEVLRATYANALKKGKELS